MRLPSRWTPALPARLGLVAGIASGLVTVNGGGPRFAMLEIFGGQNFAGLEREKVSDTVNED